MAGAIQSMQGDGLETSSMEWTTKEGVKLFGIRHLSAAGAWHIKRFLESVKPDCVLIEMPSDTTALINDIAKSGVKPPIAVLCYTTEIPAYSIVYPLALYSPEYQALLWANKKKKICRFIDLPSYVKAPLYRFQERERVKHNNLKNEALESETEELPEEIEKRIEYYKYSNNLYEKIAKIGGETDYDTYWERHFEHNLTTDVYMNGVATHSKEMRLLTEDEEREADSLSSSINTLREAYMKRQIKEAIKEGFAPEKIVVITGAYHVKGLMENEPMSDGEIKGLPKAETKMTLMPYSYYKLSTHSGYGAGNHAPYYYEMMFNAMERDNLSTLPSKYLSELNQLLRKKNGYASTATVIEAVRLANSLQYLHGGILPTLSDLHDAAVATMGNGVITETATAFASLDVGTRIGSLPDGVSQTPIQDDMNYQLKRLKLTKYKTTVAETLVLDLRENRRVQSDEAAFLDLDRSIFLNRLTLLNINFGKPAGKREGASWAENWILCWTPEVEIELVESVLYGDSIEAASAYALKERLEKSNDVIEVASLVRKACECKLPDSIHDAVKKLQSLASDSESFSDSAKAAREISFLVQYGTIRKFDTKLVIPILKELFLKASLLLLSASSCNESAAKEMASDIANMHHISQENYDIVNDEIWLKELTTLAKSDEKNPLLCGFAFSILLERNQVTENDLSTEVSRHLSKGNTPEAGALWFEGLSKRNRYVLLSRAALWRELDGYLNILDDEEFSHALVSLRRAFSSFEPSEKSGICEILAELWGVDSNSAAEFLQEELTKEEESVLDDLNDFDFGDSI